MGRFWRWLCLGCWAGALVSAGPVLDRAQFLVRVSMALGCVSAEFSTLIQWWTCLLCIIQPYASFFLQKSRGASNRVFETFGVSCESSFPEPQLLSWLVSRWCVHKSLSQHHVSSARCSTGFVTDFLPFSFWSHCGDQPHCLLSVLGCQF